MIIHLTQFIPAEAPRVRTPGKPGLSRKMTRMEKFRYDKALANAPRGMEIGHDDLYVLVDVEEMVYLLEVWELICGID